MIIIRLLVMAGIGALIGWLTNKIALISLFRPYRAIKIPIIGVWQGILPKRQKVLAKEIGNLVEKELINIDDMINSKNTKKHWFAINIENIIKENFPKVFESVKIKSIIMNAVLKGIDISEIVENKICEMDMRELEQLVISVIKKEMRHIEMLGGVLGFVIGSIQGVISIFL